ncbi:MAG: glycosyltransferase [Candidatus Levyibacteriota bacterium]
MKVGIYDPYLDDLGGGEKYITSIAECLSEDNNVTIFWDNEEDFKKLKHRFSLGLSKVKLSKNIFSKDVGFLKRLNESKKYDLLFVLSDGSIPFVASKLYVHIQQPLPFVRASVKAKLKIRRVAEFIYNSKFTKSYADKTFGVKGVVLYPPVEVKTKDVKKENIVLTVGKFRYKNIPLDDFKKQTVMIGAFKNMVEEGLRGWKLVIVTGCTKKDEPELDRIKKTAKGYPIEFLINQESNELWDIYSRSKIYWHAAGYGENLNEHPEYAEHFGISTVEAMGAGAVPIVINAGGQKEIVEKGSGFLWDTLEELKNRTEELVKDKILLERMSESAQRRAKFFSGERFCKELREIIK